MPSTRSVGGVRERGQDLPRDTCASEGCVRGSTGRVRGITQPTARFKYDFRSRWVASWRGTTNEWVYALFDQVGQPLAELARTNDMQRDPVFLVICLIEWFWL